jgi:hypothetical protein
MLTDLIVSRVRVKLLEIFLYKPQEIYYVRQLVREIDEEINAVRRELLRMEKFGMVKKEVRGNRLYYGFNSEYVLYADLLSLINKSVGLGGQIIRLKNKLGRIRFAVMSGRFIRHLPTKEGRVDLLLVGEIALPELAKIIREEEVKIGKEINYSVMTKDEFDFRKKRRDPFLNSILSNSRIMLLGDEEELTA